jgi:hypothetical protein
MKSFQEKPSSLATLGHVRISRAAIVLVLILMLVAISHLAVIEGDPPYWMEEAFIVDGGWWVNSARAKVLFGDYFAGDFGITYLLLPVYIWALEAIYTNWGVGLAQTRILTALSNITVLVIIAIVVWRMIGKKESIFATLLLGFSPFFWAQGRVGLPESLQALFIVSSFALWFLPPHSLFAAFGSGLAMTGAIAVKPTALLMGFLPVTLAGIAVYFIERIQQGSDLKPPEKWHASYRMMLAFSGLFLGAGLLFFMHILPNWEVVRSIFSRERGFYGMDWRQVLTIPGRALVSKEIAEDGGFSPIIWRVAKWSPAIIIGVWLYFLGLLLQFRAGIGSTLYSLSRLEIATIVWVLCTWLIICSYPGQPDYRYIPLIPGLAILSSLFFTRRLTQAKQMKSPFAANGSHGRVFAFCLWAVLLFPVMLVLKPWTARFIMAIGQNLPLGDQPGIEYGPAGALFMGVWFLLLVGFAGFRKSGERLGALLLGRFTAILFPVLILFQCWTIGHYFANVEKTLADRQADLANHVKEGDIVLGRLGGTLFLPLPVQTIQRLRPDDSPHEIYESMTGLDKQDGIQSRYAVIPKHFNFRPYQLYKAKFEDMVKAGYEAIHQFEVGPTRHGIPRFEFELLRRIPSRPLSR